MKTLPKKYLEFIEYLNNKVYLKDEINHNHHILPSSMGGKDIESNLTKISKADHSLAHDLLSECYEKGTREWRINKASANLISNIVDVNGDNNPFYGKRHSEKSRNKMGKSGAENFMFGKIHTKETRKKITKSKMGKKHSEETKNKISLHHVGFIDREHSQETKKLMRDLKKGENNPMWKKGSPIKFINLDGKEKTFSTIKEASEILGISITGIRNSFEYNREVTKGKFKGAKFIIL